MRRKSPPPPTTTTICNDSDDATSGKWLIWVMNGRREMVGSSTTASSTETPRGRPCPGRSRRPARLRRRPLRRGKRKSWTPLTVSGDKGDFFGRYLAFGGGIMLILLNLCVFVPRYKCRAIFVARYLFWTDLSFYACILFVCWEFFIVLLSSYLFFFFKVCGLLICPAI